MSSVSWTKTKFPNGHQNLAHFTYLSHLLLLFLFGKCSTHAGLCAVSVLCLVSCDFRLFNLFLLFRKFYSTLFIPVPSLCVCVYQMFSLSIDLVIDIQLLWFPECYEQGSSKCEHADVSTVTQHTFLNFITHISGSLLCFSSLTLWNVTGTMSILFLWF